MTLRLRLDLAYDGGPFSGWARQPGRRTVQGEVERALARVLRLPEPPAVVAAGRTDAGVHARGQVAHVDVPRADAEAAEPPAPGLPRPGQPLLGNPLLGQTLLGQTLLGQTLLGPDISLTNLAHRLGGVLPPEIRMRRVSVAPDGFDARFSALWRRYAFRVADAPDVVDPVRRHEVLTVRRRLDLGAMNEAAATLLGEHDFAAFCRSREGATTRRRLLEVVWYRDGAGLAVGRFVADAFCHSMVRALVGALLPVGEGRRRPGWPAEVLASGRRDSAVTVVPAHGLTLEEVRYPPEDELAARAAQTRAVRRPELPAGPSEEARSGRDVTAAGLAARVAAGTGAGGDRGAGPGAGPGVDPLLRGRRVLLRPVDAGDREPLAAALATPEVARWWREDTSPPGWPVPDEPDEHRYAVLVDGEVAGLIQYFEENDPDYRSASIDLLLHPRVHGRGAGSDALRTLIRHLIEERRHRRITIDPAADNAVAIRCYRAVGFRPVGVMRRYERDTAGDGWHDGLLMDLLADDFRSAETPV